MHSQSSAELSCSIFLLVVCEALLLQQKPGILNPQGSQWEGKASSTIPRSGSLWWNPAISQPWAPEPPEGLGLGPVFYSGPCAPSKKNGRASEMKRQREGNKRDRDAPIERENDSQGLLGENTITHINAWNTGSALVYSRSRVATPAGHKSGCQFCTKPTHIHMSSSCVYGTIFFLWTSFQTSLQHHSSHQGPTERGGRPSRSF